MKVIIASNNQGKIREFKQLLQPIGYQALSQAEAGITVEVEESGKTFEENALIKARAIFEKTKIPVIADDSGLEVDFLGGEPGVYSARYAPVGQRKRTILKKMEGVTDKAQRAARFVCCICYTDGNDTKIVHGRCEGYIGFEERGENGFGYDSIFMVGEKSFAELSDNEKNTVSHRGIALKKLVKELEA
ncbi:MAG: RdgB/HAM1 family non-canonical purine NTP pyrophosphatase [Oscillospiraceae bacterium]|nr:RdgB/HAM1 family non-canonical purine NTP pyrophosphatase [Oscillospiraceae bacterium]